MYVQYRVCSMGCSVYGMCVECVWSVEYGVCVEYGACVEYLVWNVYGACVECMECI